MPNSSKIGFGPEVTQDLEILELVHELKIPLFNIKSFLETLYEYNFILSEKQRLEFLETANKETNRLILLINNLVDIELQHSDFLFQGIQSRFQLSQILSQVVNSYKLTAKNKKIKIVCFFPKPDYFIYGNSDFIGQVIHNLIGNSLKYTFPQKNIFVRTRVFRSLISNLSTKREKINLSILDEGIGIPRFQLNSFERYENSFKFKNSKQSVKGTGLGLQIVKRILSKHNSRLLLLSFLRKGSMISFSLDFV